MNETEIFTTFYNAIGDVFNIELRVDYPQILKG